MASPYWLIPVSQVWDTAFGARKARIGVYPEEGETVRKVKHSSMRIENLLLALYRSTEYFSLARTFRTVWGAESVQQKSQDASGNDDGYRSYLEEK